MITDRLYTPTEMDSWLQQRQRLSLLVAVGGAIGIIIGLMFDADHFFRSYLMSFLMCFALALGCLSIQMLQFLSGGKWGVSIERILEAASRTLPLVGVLFIPVIFGMHSLYPWTHADVVAADEVLQHKHIYLNTPFFIIRAILFFVIWAGGAWFLHKYAADQYRRGNYVAVRRISAVGLVVYVFTLTFAAIDWAQSLQPHWYSTMWGFLFVAQQGLTAIPFVITAGVLLSRDESYSRLFTHERLHDLGKLFLMFVMLWAYFSFAQFLIIWEGNLKEEIPWYFERMATSWGWIGVILIVLQFAVPFVILLSRPAKKNGFIMLGLSGLVLLMRQIDLFWIVMPDQYRAGIQVHWLDIVTPIALLALWHAAFIREIRRRPLIPEGDPRLEAMLQHVG